MAQTLWTESFALHRDRRAWHEGKSIFHPDSEVLAEILRNCQIQRAAAKAGQEVRSFCDEMYKPFDVRTPIR